MVEKKRKLPIGILYLGLHNQLIKKYKERIITRKEFFCKLGKHYLIPKNLKGKVIKEMCNLNLIRRINRDIIEILDSKIDIGKEPDKLYKIAGIY